MLATISEAVLYLAKQELQFQGHYKSNASLNKGDYRELLECLAKFDSVLEQCLHGKLDVSDRGVAGVFTGVSAGIQNDLILILSGTDSISEDQIKKEIQECTFLSIQMEETTKVSAKEQLSKIICLDRKGEIIERFLKFKDVRTDRSAPSISDIVKKILEKYGPSLKDYLIMQTYVGGTVMSGHLGGVQALVRQEYPYAYFFHCAAHRLK